MIQVGTVLGQHGAILGQHEAMLGQHEAILAQHEHEAILGQLGAIQASKPKNIDFHEVLRRPEAENVDFP